MHADGKSTLASVSKWNSGKVDYHSEHKNSLLCLVLNQLERDKVKKLYNALNQRKT